MKRIKNLNRIFVTAIAAILLVACLSVSALAAKEMFTVNQIDEVAITGIDAPEAGKKFDFTAEEISQKYNVIKVAWMSQSGNNYISTTESAMAGTKYTVYVVLEVATANHYFKTDSSRMPALSSVTVNGNAANANNAMDYTLFSIDASKYEQDTTYQKYLTVMYTFPEVKAPSIEAVEFGIPELVPGKLIPTTWQASGISIDGVNGGANNGQVSVKKVEWTLQDGTVLSGNATFKYGEKYTLTLTLGTIYGTSFATDPSHYLSQPDKPFPAVTVKMNGKTATVLPTYDSYSNLSLVASCVLDCDTAAQINEIKLTDVDAPVAGKAPDYTFTGGAGYEHNGRNDAFYKNGMCWSEVNSSYVLSDGTQAFLPGKAYQVDIRIKAKEGYEFATNSNGNVSIIATVNGKSASVSGNKNEILVTYAFSDTGSLAIGKVGVTDVDAPETGRSPDYDATYTNVNYGAANYNNATTKNGISWYNETDKKAVSVGDKFEAGKTYTAQIMIWSNEGYEFQYKSGDVNVVATVNGKSAEVSSRNNEEVTLFYTFPKTEEHKHSAKKVDEFEATCKEEGKKAYYFCPECGKNFEDSRCTKEIADVNDWGKIEKLEHSGGKATCDNRAICKSCGEYYGELADHEFGTSWESVDAMSHAHKCEVCGIFDEAVPHGGGAAKCGELAKCADCGAEYGEVMQHQWSSDLTYTDAKGHAYKCTVCGEHDTVVAHNGGTADCQNKAVCSDCGTAYGKRGEHKYSSEWLYKTASGHAHGCTVEGCAEHDEVVKHTPGAEATETSAQLCVVCGYVIKAELSHKHNISKIDEVDATCTTNGKKAYYYCEACASIFSDSKGNNEISDDSELIIPATGHKESKWRSDEDTHWKECTVKGCDEITSDREAHDFNKAGKCTVCSYKIVVEDEAPETPEAPDTSDPTDNSGENVTPPSDVADDTDTESEPDNKAMWIVVIISGIVAIACIIVVVAVLAKKNKK